MTIHASWRDGYHAKVDATVAYKELQSIRKSNNGEITPENILEKARLKKSPLHKAFNWDDKKAANQFRLYEARNMSRCLNITIKEKPERPVQWLAVVTVARPDEQPARKVYKSIEDILKDPVSRDELLSRAITEALSYRKKYHMLSELALIFTAMDEVTQHAESMIK